MIITLFESVQKAYTRPEWVIDNSWDEIAKFLTTWQDYPKKEDVPLFNMWEFNINGEPGRKRIYENNNPTEAYETVEGTIRRCKANAKLCHGLVLDFDGKARIDRVLEEHSWASYCLYTTFRHTEETHKYRVVFPFAKALCPSDLRKKEKAISQTFQGVDPVSFSESQSFYLHSGPNRFTHINEGQFLDPDWFEDEIIPERVDKPKIEYKEDDYYKEKLIESLATCSGLHYAGVGTKYGVLVLVALCKSAGLSIDQYDTICWNMAASDSALQEENIRKSAWYGWNPYSGITARVREEFIAAYGGRSKFGMSLLEKKKTPQEIREYVMSKYGAKKDE